MPFDPNAFSDGFYKAQVVEANPPPHDSLKDESKLGIDFSTKPHLDFSKVAGLENLAEAIARRLATPRGGLFYDRLYGFDVREYLNEEDTAITRFELSSRVEAECRKDPRVNRVSIQVESISDDSIKLTVYCHTALGPFTLVLEIDELTVEVMEVDFIP